MDDPRAMAGLYSVRMTMQGIQYTVERMLRDHNGQIEATIKAEVEAVLASFDFKAEVARVTERCLKELIERAIHGAIAHALDMPAAQQSIRAAVARAMGGQT